MLLLFLLSWYHLQSPCRSSSYTALRGGYGKAKKKGTTCFSCQHKREHCCRFHCSLAILLYLSSSYVLLVLFLSQSALHHMLFLTFSTGLSFHSAGHMCSPQICTPGALGSSMDQCPRICAQNMSQVVSLASKLPSGKCHCLTHISQISSITQATLLPPEETSGLCPCHCAGSCQVRPALFPLSV